jgi:glycosyltransferase involved in cell wall biosynthesis
LSQIPAFSVRAGGKIEFIRFLGDIALERSVSLLFPVHNAQHTLARNVSVVLDVLPDLTDRFEVLIIDDGSTDATEEVADDLARKYPQVNVVRHAEQRGLAESINMALERSVGEIVFVPDPEQDFEPEALSQLWQLRDDRDVSIAQRAKPGCGLRMIRREDIGRLQEIGIEMVGSKQAIPAAAITAEEAVFSGGEPSGGFLGTIGSFLAAE